MRARKQITYIAAAPVNINHDEWKLLSPVEQARLCYYQKDLAATKAIESAALATVKSSRAIGEAAAAYEAWQATIRGGG